MKLLTDGRWIGPHGIGRFAFHVLSRLPAHCQLHSGPRPLSLLDPLWLSYKIGLHHPDLFFSPGFSLPAVSSSPFVFTIHDLICVHLPGVSRKSTFARKLYFQTIVRPAARRAFRVLTVSEYSRLELLKWTGLRDDAIVNVGNGIDPIFSPLGPRHDPGFNYILYVGNFKPHKNLGRLLAAFAQLDYPHLRLLLTGYGTPRLRAAVQQMALESRVQWLGCVDDRLLAELYRGALLVVQPSLMEGFGLPPVEGMACGTPVAVSCATSLPEIVGDAGVFFDPLDICDIRRAIEQTISNMELRRRMIAAGFRRALLFRWEDVAGKVAQVLGVSCPFEAGAARTAFTA
ncbi:MAG: glycosyltransferase family 4 protein [Acidobacteriaceae bacterium]|nr:glycosyltransferase family 4 protein [Acidobacteriaceae bacterium]